MATAQNGWPVADPSEIRTWRIPLKNGRHVEIPLRAGVAGFVLAVFVLWWHEVIESIANRIRDDWGYAVRMIRGYTDEYTNHAPGTAVDINATLHPLGTDPEDTLSATQIAAIRRRIKLTVGVLRWGGDYRGRKDAMHTEVVGNYQATRAYAYAIRYTPRGRRIAAANPRPLDAKVTR